MKNLLFFCLILGAAGLFAEEREMPRFEIPTARGNAMGGAHVAYTDNVFSLLVNPAAMVRVEQRSFFTLAPSLYSPQTLFDLINPMVDALAGNDIGKLGDAADALSKRHGRIPLGFELREFPLSFAWVADGLGFGLWDRLYVNPNIVGTTIDVNVYADAILPVGMAFKIIDIDDHSLDAGFVVKPFVRLKASEKLNIFDMLDTDSGVVDQIGTPVIAGAGFDLGLLYRWNGLQAGLTFDDIVTRGGVVTSLVGNDTSSYYVPFSMNLGLAYILKVGNLWADAPSLLGKTGVTFAFDWRNITNAFQQDDYTRRNAALDIGLGLEISLFDLFNLRAGMSEMLPSFGLGFDLGAVEMNVAYYGKELGLEPGQLSAAVVEFAVCVRPGAKKRDWPWIRNSLVGLITGR